MKKLLFIWLIFSGIFLEGKSQKQVFRFSLFEQQTPFFFSVPAEDGNYRVTVTFGSNTRATETSLKAESRRLFIEQVKTDPGEFISKTFTVNKRNKYFERMDGQTRIIDSVRIKPREYKKLNWDNDLTFEINGPVPGVTQIEIEKTEDVITVFLCGNSTVVDQDNEPWASWGQMIPSFFNEQVSIANYAESGESSNTFIYSKRLEKVLCHMKPGDYILIEFGHNDEKQKGEDKGAYKHFTTYLKKYIDEARKRGGIPILLTPTERRAFDQAGRWKETHGDFPQAVRDLAIKEEVPVIDLSRTTSILYRTLGAEGSKAAFVHYPAGTFPQQEKDLADNTHFNSYGAYQIAKCVIEGLKHQDIPLSTYIRSDFSGYDPSFPDSVNTFIWYPSPQSEILKPDGN